MHCRTAAAVHVEAQRLQVTASDGVLYIYGTVVIPQFFPFLSENFCTIIEYHLQ